MPATIPKPPGKGADAKSAVFWAECVTLWNTLGREEWVSHTAFPKRAVAQMTALFSLVAEANPEATWKDFTRAYTAAIHYAAALDWTKGAALSAANLGSNGKLEEYWQASLAETKPASASPTPPRVVLPPVVAEDVLAWRVGDRVGIYMEQWTGESEGVVLDYHPIIDQYLIRVKDGDGNNRHAYLRPDQLKATNG